MAGTLQNRLCYQAGIEVGVAAAGRSIGRSRNKVLESQGSGGCPCHVPLQCPGQRSAHDPSSHHVDARDVMLNEDSPVIREENLFQQISAHEIQ